MADQTDQLPDDNYDGRDDHQGNDERRGVKDEPSRSRSRRHRRREREREGDREDRDDRGEDGGDRRDRRDRDRRRRSRSRRRRSRRRKSRGKSRDSSGSPAQRAPRKKRQLPGLWDSTVPAQNQQVVESMLMGDPKTRELYIGHLAPGCNPKMLEDLFNSLFQALPEYKRKYGNQPPVCKAQMYGNGTFAFVEFRSKEVAQTATKFDQCVLMNHPIHIGRPQGFVPPPPGQDPPTLDVTPLLRSGLIPSTPMSGPPALMNAPQQPMALGAPPGMIGGPGGPPPQQPGMQGGPRPPGMQNPMMGRPPMMGGGPPQQQQMMGGPPQMQNKPMMNGPGPGMGPGPGTQNPMSGGMNNMSMMNRPPMRA